MILVFLCLFDSDVPINVEYQFSYLQMIVGRENPIAFQTVNEENISIFKKIWKLLNVSAINKELDVEEMHNFNLRTKRKKRS